MSRKRKGLIDPFSRRDLQDVPIHGGENAPTELCVVIPGLLHCNISGVFYVDEKRGIRCPGTAFSLSRLLNFIATPENRRMYDMTGALKAAAKLEKLVPDGEELMEAFQQRMSFYRQKIEAELAAASTFKM